METKITELQAFCGGHWSEHPSCPVSDWQSEVANDYTRRGYWEWLAGLLEMEQHAHTIEVTMTPSQHIKTRAYRVALDFVERVHPDRYGAGHPNVEMLEAEILTVVDEAVREAILTTAKVLTPNPTR